MLRFDPNTPPSTPRPSSTVLVLRPNESASSIEIFCVIRHPKSSFLGGAVAFPGGKVDPSDTDQQWATLIKTSPTWEQQLGQDLPAPATALGIAAYREALEEAAILAVDGPSLNDLEACELRRTIEAGSTLLAELHQKKIKLDLTALHPFARWITPEAEPRRYDAMFFLLALPAGQSGTPDNKETTGGFWSTPSQVLDRWVRSEIMLAPPTTRALELLKDCQSVAQAIELAAEQTLKPICPCYVHHETSPYLALPGDPSHPIKEPRVSGPSRFVLRDGRFVSEWP